LCIMSQPMDRPNLNSIHHFLVHRVPFFGESGLRACGQDELRSTTATGANAVLTDIALHNESVEAAHRNKRGVREDSQKRSSFSLVISKMGIA
jgi:hypothetical protein